MTRVIESIALASVVSLAASTSLAAQPARTSANAPADAFSRVRCGPDLTKTLIGGTLPDKPVAAIEAAHADIKLKDVGGSMIDDSVFLGGWEICGHEYQLLVRRGRIDDALQFPVHSRRRPAFLGSCSLHDKRVGDVLAVLDNPAPRAKDQPRYTPDDTTSLPAVAAWRVDAKSRRFTGIPIDGLRCPRGGIFTIDGGT